MVDLIAIKPAISEPTAQQSTAEVEDLIASSKRSKSG
jgi:hypothetical protein